MRKDLYANLHFQNLSASITCELPYHLRPITCCTFSSNILLSILTGVTENFLEKQSWLLHFHSMLHPGGLCHQLQFCVLLQWWTDYCSIANSCFTGATGSRGENLWHKCQQQMEAETEKAKGKETDIGGIKERGRKAINPFFFWLAMRFQKHQYCLFR